MQEMLTTRLPSLSLWKKRREMLMGVPLFKGPFILLKTASRHPDKLNNDILSYYVGEATKVAMVEYIKGLNLWTFCGFLF